MIDLTRLYPIARYPRDLTAFDDRSFIETDPNTRERTDAVLSVDVTL